MQAVERRRVFALFAIVVLGSSLGSLAQTATNAMIPSIMEDMGVGVGLGQWLTTSYMLVLGVTVPVASYFSRHICLRSHVLAGIGLFIAGSVIDLLAPGFWVMLLGRVVQAASVGLLMPLMNNIAMLRFPAGTQATAMGVGGIAMGFAPNIGPTIGGAMDFAWGWRSFFVLMVALSAALLIWALVAVKPEKPAFPKGRFDVPSFVLSTLGFSGVLLGLSNLSSFAVSSPWIWAPLVVGAVLIGVFVRRQRALEHPLVHLGIFADSQFVAGMACIVFLYASFFGVTLIVPLYVVGLCGGTSLDAGMVLLPATVVALVMNPLSGWLFDKYGVRRTVVPIGAFLVLGSVAFLFIDEHTPLWVLMAYQCVRGVGISGLISPVRTWALARLEPGLVPDGSSASVLIQQVAGALGTALMVLAVTASGRLACAWGMPVLPYQLSFGVSALFAVATYAVILVRMR